MSLRKVRITEKALSDILIRVQVWKGCEGGTEIGETDGHADQVQDVPSSDPPPSPAACELKVGAMGPGAVSDLYWALARLRYQVGLNECLLLCRRDSFECMMCYQKDIGLTFHPTVQPGKDLERALRVRVDALLRVPPRPMASTGAEAATAVGAAVPQSLPPPSAITADSASDRSSGRPLGSLVADSSPQGQGMRHDWRGGGRRAIDPLTEGMD